jgi:tRNA threonylcarbamoyladenosine dehydratase
MYEGLLASVQGGEEKMLRYQTGGDPSISVGLKTPITTGDIAFLAEEIFKGRSAITGLTTRLILTRWRKPTSSIMIRIGEGASEQKSSNLRLTDLVLMTKEEGTRHDKLILRGDQQPEDVYDAATVAKVEAALKETAVYEKYR